MKKVLMGIFISSSIVMSLNADDMQMWERKGFQQYEAKHWISIGVKTPKEARAWTKLRVRSPKKWIELGFKTPEEVKPWKKARLRVGYAEGWIKAGVKSPQEIQLWRDAGYTAPHHAKEWIDVGVTNPKDVKLYTDANIYAYDLEKSKISIDELKRWQKAGFSVKGIQTWKKLGFNSPSDTKEWVKIVGNNPHKVQKAIRNGFDTPQSYLLYKDIDVKHASILNDLNIKPNELIKSMSKIETRKGSSWGYFFHSEDGFLDKYNAVKSECKTINWFYDFKPYDSNKIGQCYIIQNHGAGRLPNNKIVFKSKNSINVTGKKLSKYEASRMDSFEQMKFAKQNYAREGYLYIENSNYKRNAPIGIIKIIKGSFGVQDLRTFEASKAKILYMK